MLTFSDKSHWGNKLTFNTKSLNSNSEFQFSIQLSDRYKICTNNKLPFYIMYMWIIDPIHIYIMYSIIKSINVYVIKENIVQCITSLNPWYNYDFQKTIQAYYNMYWSRSTQNEIVFVFVIIIRQPIKASICK